MTYQRTSRFRAWEVTSDRQELWNQPLFQGDLLHFPGSLANVDRETVESLVRHARLVLIDNRLDKVGGIEESTSDLEVDLWREGGEFFGCGKIVRNHLEALVYG